MRQTARMFLKGLVLNRSAFFAFVLTVASVAMTLTAYYDIFHDLYAYSSYPLAIVLKTAGYYLFYFCLAFFFYVLLASIPRIGFFLAGAVFLTFGAISIAYVMITGYAPTSESVWMLYGTPHGMLGENAVHVSGKLLFVSFAFPVVALSLAGGIVFKWSERFPRVTWRTAAIYGLLFLGGLCVIVARHPKRIVFDATASAIESLTFFLWEFHILQPKREVLPALAPGERPKNNIVFIVDESIRGDYLTINNPGIETTPFLSAYAKANPQCFFNYGVAVSATTQSLGSGLCLFSQVENLPDTQLRATTAPLIWKEAERQGYRTVYYDAQGGWPNRFAGKDAFTMCDTLFSGRCLDMARPQYDQDFVYAERIHDILSKGSGYFIVMCKMGAHFQYERKYPEDSAAYFTPHLGRHESPYGGGAEIRRKLINSYKNVLRYNVDGFFRRLLSPLPANTTVIYTSDHAQSLMENGTYKASHGGIERVQAYVPLVVISNDPDVQLRIVRPESLGGVHLSHFNIAPTIRSILSQFRDSDPAAAYSSLFSVPFRPGDLKYTNKLPWSGDNIFVIPQDEVMADSPRYMY